MGMVKVYTRLSAYMSKTQFSVQGCTNFKAHTHTHTHIHIPMSGGNMEYALHPPLHVPYCRGVGERALHIPYYKQVLWSK